MILSMDTHALTKKFGEEKAFRMMKNAGFGGVDYSFYWLDKEAYNRVYGAEYKQNAKETKALLDKIGLLCNQAHASFDFNSRKDTMDISNTHYSEIVKSMEFASILGAHTIVVHAVEPMEGESVFETNLKFYKSLEPYCSEFNIHIAIENLFASPYDNERKMYIGNKFGAPEAMLEIIQALNSPWFVVCVDVGHASITGTEPEDYISALDNKLLKVVHIQDNDYENDRHYLPYVGKINWDKVTCSLKSIDFKGDMNFEIFHYLNRFDDELLEYALDFAVKVGNHLIKKVEN